MKVELYKIYDEFNEYNYTSSNEKIIITNTRTEIDNVVFLPRAIQRGEIEIDNIDKDNFKFTAPLSMPPLNEFVVYNPDRIFWLKVFNEDGIVLYVGQINTIEYSIDNHSVDVNCNSIINVFANNIPKAKFSPNCNFNLFDGKCSLIRENYKETLDNSNYIIDNNNTLSITTIKNDGYYSSGTLHIQNQINFIKKHSNGKLYLMYPIKNITFSGDILLYPGCNKTINSCLSKFNNIENFGGYPFVPEYNPYESI